MSYDAIGRREPAVNLPGVVLGAILALVAIHLVRGWLSPMADAELLFGAGFIPARWSLAIGWAEAGEIIRAAAETGDPDLQAARAALAQFVVASGETRPWSLLTYALLHGSWMHVLLNCIWLAAFASPVVRRCGAGRAVALAAATTVGAALAQWLANPLSPQVMIGASGAVSGFMGAAALFVFTRPSPFRSWPAGPRTERTSALDLLRNRSALFFLGTWLGINLLVGLVSQPLGIAEGGIAWQAHIGGLLTGLLVFPWLDPVRRSPSLPYPPAA
ncbi:rhomboid family intramembrane serine protease [Enterovirga aerilata]|uniref:Rhomboid family intramembrane serine protease n=1 Tax=Enterovirga aerilata TaxID=2730920 RepID=A0A849I6E5_9HYPH|nr:rhomboid family intramembrane serine protease [Enterovirga sp. DB1703]NNM73264.1 rhomboid family intramembrane serine protease [Enterovirga sp. DB1703]